MMKLFVSVLWSLSIIGLFAAGIAAQEWEIVYEETFEAAAVGEQPEGWYGGDGDDTDGAYIFWEVNDFVGFDNEPEGTQHNISIIDDSDQGNAVIAAPFPAVSQNFKLTLYVGNNRLGSSFLRVAMGHTEEGVLDGGGKGGIGYLNMNMNTTNGLTPNFNSAVDGMVLPHSNAAMHKVEITVVRDEADAAFAQMAAVIDGVQVLPPTGMENPLTEINLIYLITSTSGTNVDLSVDDLRVEQGGEGFELPPDWEFTAVEAVLMENFESTAAGQAPEGWVQSDGDDSNGDSIEWAASDFVDFTGGPAGSARTFFLRDESAEGNIVAGRAFEAQTQPLRLSFYAGTAELSDGEENDDTIRVALGDSADGGIASSGKSGIGFMDITFRPQTGDVKVDFSNTEHPAGFSVPHEDGQMHFIEYIIFRDEEEPQYNMRKAFIDGVEAYPLSFVENLRAQLDMLSLITYTGGFHHIYVDDVTIETGVQEEAAAVRSWELY